MAHITKPNVAITVQDSGIWNDPPACTAALATRPIIHRPDSTVMDDSTSTTLKNRSSTPCISCTRKGGSSMAAAGRKKKWVNTMPPTHTMMDRRWISFSRASIMLGFGVVQAKMPSCHRQRCCPLCAQPNPHTHQAARATEEKKTTRRWFESPFEGTSLGTWSEPVVRFACIWKRAESCDSN